MATEVDDFAGLVESQGGGGGAADPNPVAELNYSHDGMVNLVLLNRGITQNEIARRLGYSVSWVSQVMSSDLFQAKLNQRAAEIEDPLIRDAVRESLKTLASRSLEILHEKLSQATAVIPDNLALRALELSTRALGYGAKDVQVNIQNNVGGQLEELGGRLERLLDRKQHEVQASPRATEIDCSTPRSQETA